MLLMNKDIKVNKIEKSRINEVDWDNLTFGSVFTDHMLIMNYADGKWGKPEIKPLSSLSLHPATAALHYGQELFEGIKAYKHKNGKVTVFRPDMNGMRFKESCIRMCMPTMEVETFVQAVTKFTEVEKDWVSDRDKYSLYLRPLMFATDAFVGVRESRNYTFLIIGCPVGAYYNEPVSVKVEEHFTRAALGGVGRAKNAGNYGASLYPTKLAHDEGFKQLLWTDSQTHEYFEESGTMNVMFEMDGVLITPTEDQDTILRGVTKRSVIEIAQHWGLKVEERKVSVKEIIEGIKRGAVTDAFGIGTAATIAPIKSIGYRGEIFELQPVEKRGFSNKVSQYMNDIRHGKTEDIFGWNFAVE